VVIQHGQMPMLGRLLPFLPLPFAADGVEREDPISKGWHLRENRICSQFHCLEYPFHCEVDLHHPHFVILVWLSLVVS
jgi:hypothetical protein